MCKEFKEFNYLLKIDPDLLTKDIKGFKTYEEFKDGWIYEWNKDVPWVEERPWTDTGVWKEPKPVKHTCKPFNYKTGCSDWPTCGWRNDGYCNGGNLPRAYIIRNTLRYQDLEWYDALKDSKLKEEALRNKAIMEGLIDEDDESSNNGWRRWDGLLWVNGYKLANKASIMELNEDILKIYYSEDQYAVSIKEDTAYPCLHSPKTTKERRSIRRIQRRPIHRIGNIVIKYSEDIKRGPYS
ncbi:hypothetical protein Tco_0778931 [Tanacetum coccineum]